MSQPSQDESGQLRRRRGGGAEPDTRWEWGWRADTDEATVWEVSGPGDGFPTHNTYLQTAWGRSPDIANGDIVGFADRIADSVNIRAYSGRRVPDSVVARLRSLIPAETQIACVEPSEKPD